jgi:NADP-dependent 3-hydroxy acid dehydrogenase YdfG
VRHVLSKKLAAAERASSGDNCRIINLGSWIARLGIPTASLFSSTKGAMEALTRGFRQPSSGRLECVSM